MAVMDALMAVGAMETVSAVKTCGAVELLGGGASWEAALLHWVNEVRSRGRNVFTMSRSQVAKRVEHRASNLMVAGSIPGRAHDVVSLGKALLASG